jgi:hypothetical protein
MIQRVDTSADTKSCITCGRVLPATEFASSVSGLASECRDCAWERMCRIPEEDLAVIARVYRRYRGKNREKILERMRRGLAVDPQRQGLSAQTEAGYVGFAARMRKRRARRHEAGGWHTTEDILRLCDEQGGRCFYCGKELNDKYDLDRKTPKSRGGTDWPENLCCACEQCCHSKQERTAEEFVEYLADLRRRS